MSCEGCKNSATPIVESVPYVVYQSAMAREERKFKKMWVLVLVLVALLVGTNAGWLWYESQFETVTTAEEYFIEQDAESGNNNSIINGGEILNG